MNAPSFAQDRFKYGRMQRRLLHLISQVAEEHLGGVLHAKMPIPAATDTMHPAKKILGL